MNVDDSSAETAMGTTHAIEHSTDRVDRLEGLSRRRFLRAAAAAGGGLMLSLRLPVADREAAAADETFVPNAFIRIGADTDEGVRCEAVVTDGLALAEWQAHAKHQAAPGDGAVDQEMTSR